MSKSKGYVMEFSICGESDFWYEVKPNQEVSAMSYDGGVSIFYKDSHGNEQEFSVYPKSVRALGEVLTYISEMEDL